MASIPYDPVLTMTLLIGAGAAAPSILALGFANYSNRGDLLARSKGLQLAVFLVLSLVLTPPMGPLGAAIAVVASDLLIQFGVLTIVIIRQTLQRPLRHVAFLAVVMVTVTLAGWALGTAYPFAGAGQRALAVLHRMRAVAGCRRARGQSARRAANLRNRLIGAIPR